MQLLFCSNPLEPAKPDELYEEEARAAQQLGIQNSLINFEALVYENDAKKAIKKVRQPSTQTETAIYRGWMLPPSKYQLLYNALSNRGIKLINDPQSYEHCHYLPRWLELFQGHTPESAWIDHSELPDLEEERLKLVMKTLQVFHSQPVIVKDFVKSAKHHWREACFIPDSSEGEQVRKVISRFLELRGSDLEGGLVFRKFVAFKSLTTHSKSGMPLTKEFRLFVLDGEIVHWFNYWEEGNYENCQPPIEQFAALAKKPQSRFFTMDIAQTETDEWLVVELGDGQVAGLPENTSVSAFYQSLHNRLSRP